LVLIFNLTNPGSLITVIGKPYEYKSVMKRLHEIIYLTIFAVVLMPSAFSEGKSTDSSGIISVISAKPDTTGMMKLLDIKQFRLDLIPPSSGVQFYKDRILYLSLSKNERKMAANQISFGAIEAYSGYVADSVLNNRRIFSPASAFSYPCEAITFSHDYDTIYYTRIPENGKKEKIYRASFSTGSKNMSTLVSDDAPLEFCLDDFSYSHPALSANGKFMIFASDKTGSRGGMDLFITRKKGNKWSTPENLGDAVNTPGNEYYPFLDNENNLYFSSDRLPGFGGFDIFTCRFNGSSWDKPVNLSDHINTDQDDIAFTINKIDEQSAFFTRRLRSGKGESQLFRITFRQKSDVINLITIANIFNGNPVPAVSSEIAAITGAKEITGKEQQVKTAPPSVKKEEKNIPDTSNYFKKQGDRKTVASVQNNAAASENTAQKRPVTTEKTVNPADKKEVVKPNTFPEQPGTNEIVTYRVQLLPNASQIKDGEVVINGKSYRIFEYKYLGAIRYTVGEFSSLSQAVSLQRLCRQAGYPQAFVAAFKNGVRSLDQALFR